MSPGEQQAVQVPGVGLPAQNHSAARTTQGLVGCGGDEVAVGNRTGVLADGDQACGVGHVRHQQGAAFPSDLTHSPEVDFAGIGAGSGHDEPGPVLLGQFSQGVVVDRFRVLPDSVGNESIHPAGEVQRVAMGEVPPVRQVHAENGLPGLQGRHVHRYVGLGSGMRLHVGMFGAEKLPGPVDGQLLHHVGKLAAPIVTATGVALRVLVGEHAAGGLQDGLAHEILRGNEFQLVGLTTGFPVDGVGNLRVDQRKASCEFGVDGHGGCPLKMGGFPERRTGEEPRQARHPGVQMLTKQTRC